jgi:hypothetical protein
LKVRNAKWKNQNPTYFKDNSYKYIETNKKSTQQWKENNPSYFQNYWDINKSKLQIQKQEWFSNNPLYMDEWFKNNPHKQKEYNKNSYNKKSQNPIYKIQNSLRAKIHMSLNSLNKNKSESTLKIIGLDNWNLLKFLKTVWFKYLL